MLDGPDGSCQTGATVPGQPLACMLGGARRRTLYILSGKVMVTPEQSRAMRSGTTHTLEVAVAGAGRPS